MKSLFWLVLLACVAGLAVAQAPATGVDPLKVLPDVLSYVGKADPPAKMILKPGDKVAFMGDSITAGGGYVRLALFVINANYPDIKPVFINAGVSGHKAENMEPRFEKDMKLAEKPAVCFINVGINDVWHRLSQPHDQNVLDAYKANVIKMVDKAQAAGAQTILLTPTIIQEDAKNEGNTRLLLYVEAMKQVAVEKKCAVVDLHTLFTNALAAKPAALRITGDGVHMNAYGDAIMALGVLRGLGMADEKIVATDITAAYQVKPLGMSLAKAAEVLEVPVTRFFKPELVKFLGF